MLVYKIIMFILCLNITAMMIPESFPQLKYSIPANATAVDVDSMVSNWNPVIGSIPLIGDIVTATYTFFNVFRSLVWGFPDLLEQIGVASTVVWGLRVIFSAVLTITFIQLISGRILEE